MFDFSYSVFLLSDSVRYDSFPVLKEYAKTHQPFIGFNDYRHFLTFLETTDCQKFILLVSKFENDENPAFSSFIEVFDPVSCTCVKSFEHSI
ncbi:hypothetical protein [Tortoise microvirus 50]|nr:hypothetical protein [Tortoise microvirus 50]